MVTIVSHMANVPRKPGALGPLDLPVATHVDLFHSWEPPPPCPDHRAHTSVASPCVLWICSCQRSHVMMCHLQNNLGLPISALSSKTLHTWAQSTLPNAS